MYAYNNTYFAHTVLLFSSMIAKEISNYYTIIIIINVSVT